MTSNLIRRLLLTNLGTPALRVVDVPNTIGRGGDAGEEITVKYCKKNFMMLIASYIPIRIPIPETYQNKGEVDVIISLPKATFFLEVKHWKGLIDVDDEEILHQ